MNLPKARTTNLVVQQLGTEVLIYDTNTNQAYCLNETAAIVFNACGSAQTFARLRDAHKFTDDLIHLALDELKKRNLLADSEAYQSPFAGMSRRTVVRKVGLASLIALPMIVGLSAPLAARAASGNTPVANCARSNSDICSGRQGARVTYVTYGSTNGTCGGTASAPQTVDCFMDASICGQEPGPTEFRLARDGAVTGQTQIC